MAKTPLSVCYVSTNLGSPLKLGQYILEDGKPLFDIGILFAANINFDKTTKNAVLYFNETVTEYLSNVEFYIRPLQAKGIKVLLSILGNHQLGGISNFPNQAAASVFAGQLADVVRRYGLDGIDFDDEWSDYPITGPGAPNPFSFPFLISALRAQLPDKIISLFFYGPASSTLSYEGTNVASLLDYSWNSGYGSFIPPNIPGMSKAQLAAAAVNLGQGDSHTTLDDAVKLAEQTFAHNYGAYLYYDLPNTDDSAYLTKVSRALYGKSTVYIE